jgi:hypothetical protein
LSRCLVTDGGSLSQQPNSAERSDYWHVPVLIHPQYTLWHPIKLPETAEYPPTTKDGPGSHLSKHRSVGCVRAQFRNGPGNGERKTRTCRRSQEERRKMFRLIVALIVVLVAVTARQIPGYTKLGRDWSIVSGESVRMSERSKAV